MIIGASLVTAYNELVVPPGTPNGIYNHAILPNGSAVLYFKPVNSTTPFRQIKNFVKVVNASNNAPAVITPPTSKRGVRASEKSVHCTGTYAYGDDYDDMIGAEWAYVDYISERSGDRNHGRYLHGNTFGVVGHGVGYGCMFGGNTFYFTGQDYANYMEIVNEFCGTRDKGWYNTNYGSVGWGRVQTGEPFCGGGGIAYGYSGNM